MKLLRYSYKDSSHVGLLTSNRVLSLDILSKYSDKELKGSLKSFIEVKQYQLIKQSFEEDQSSFIESDYLKYEDLHILPPISRPEKIICVGLNYLDHVSEGTDLDVSEEPVLFSKFNNALAANGEVIPKPLDGEQIDYECELVVIMGETAKDVSQEEALDYVFGYTIGNDLSVRDLQFKSGQWILGKTPDKFSPIGPVIVTSGSIDSNQLDISTKRNGKIVQQSNTDKMICNCAKIISYISK